jgi:carbamoyltransferase
MTVYGICANEHEASVAVVRDGKILFASDAERYSRKKNDAHLNAALLHDARMFGEPDLIVWYEKPWLKRTRKLWAGQYSHAFKSDGGSYLRRFGLNAPVKYVSHHESHAAGGFFTSPFDDAAILVVDAIGEWDTISAWYGGGTHLKKLWSQRYPHSLGLLYSAFTQRVGLKPNEEEYILMGMAAYGRPLYRNAIREGFIANRRAPWLELRKNIHRGIRWWRPELIDRENIAASIQLLTEQIIIGLVKWLARVTRNRRLVLMGGVALNCVANSRIANLGLFEDIWIMPNPGDSGSSIGAAAAYLRQHLDWTTPYLGHEIARSFDTKGALADLLAGEVIGVANGRAEFGPRALGNRSLLADPRGPHMKNKVNRIKKRESFRPFAPVILAEQAHEYFDMPVKTSPYMQFVARVRSPEMFSAITHLDGTARVQTLTYAQNPVLYQLVNEFYRKTGCPMLLNTSLNIKGEPLVNTWDDAMRFQATSGIRVF